MSYTAEISRTNPSMFLFLIDQSGSMEDSIAGETKKKSEFVSDAVNRTIQNLVIKCAKSEGIRDYYYVGAIGYGVAVQPAFGGNLAGEVLVPISKLGENPVDIEERSKKVSDGAGGLVEQQVRFPIWFYPLANGGTPMCQALDQAKTIISDWTNAYAQSFPPIVINITDGEATDGDPLPPASVLRNVLCADGNTLLFNIHISSRGGKAIEFPHSESELPDQYAQQLFQMSSELPDHLLSTAKQEGYPVSNGSRGFIYNADATALVRFLDIGTRPSNLR